MATEASINAQLSDVNASISSLLSGAPFDHEQGRLKIDKSPMLKELREYKKELEAQLVMVPAVKTRHVDTDISRMGQESTLFRGDIVE